MRVDAVTNVAADSVENAGLVVGAPAVREANFRVIQARSRRLSRGVARGLVRGTGCASDTHSLQPWPIQFVSASMVFQ